VLASTWATDTVDDFVMWWVDVLHLLRQFKLTLTKEPVQNTEYVTSLFMLRLHVAVKVL